jgi:ATP-binding cassette subfamily F protein uup
MKIYSFSSKDYFCKKITSVNYLSVENISKSFGERTLFENISFGINKDQKIAFIAKTVLEKPVL